MTRSRGIGRGRHPRSKAALKRGGQPAPAIKDGALTHGGYAEVARERLDAKARTIFDAISADAPLRDHDGELPRHDAVVVRLLADCLCRLDGLGAWLNGRWKTPEARAAVELEMRLRSQALDLAESMGMTPRSRARLGLDVVRAGHFDLAATWAREDDDVLDAEVSDE